MFRFMMVMMGLMICAGFLPKACNKSKTEYKKMTIIKKKYLALGDSYTIGEAVSAQENFPNQLVRLLNNAGLNVGAPQIIATTGWTTTDLTAAIEQSKPESDFDIVTLLIGVNNQYQQKPLNLYKKEFKSLLSSCISFTKADTKKVLVISIPDYGITPFAKELNPTKISKELDAYNIMAQQMAAAYNIEFVNITAISRDTNKSELLLAQDGLHPSAIQYGYWVEKILAPAKKILASE